MVCYGETPKKLENGVYQNESGTRLIEIKNDTLKFLYCSSSSIEEGEKSYYPLAICKITEASNTIFEINSSSFGFRMSS